MHLAERIKESVNYRRGGCASNHLGRRVFDADHIAQTLNSRAGGETVVRLTGTQENTRVVLLTDHVVEETLVLAQLHRHPVRQSVAVGLINGGAHSASLADREATSAVAVASGNEGAEGVHTASLGGLAGGIDGKHTRDDLHARLRGRGEAVALSRLTASVVSRV